MDGAKALRQLQEARQQRPLQAALEAVAPIVPERVADGRLRRLCGE